MVLGEGSSGVSVAYEIDAQPRQYVVRYGGLPPEKWTSHFDVDEALDTAEVWANGGFNPQP